MRCSLPVMLAIASIAGLGALIPETAHAQRASYFEIDGHEYLAAEFDALPLQTIASRANRANCPEYQPIVTMGRMWNGVNRWPKFMFGANFYDDNVFRPGGQDRNVFARDYITIRYGSSLLLHNASWRLSCSSWFNSLSPNCQILIYGQFVWDQDRDDAGRGGCILLLDGYRFGGIVDTSRDDWTAVARGFVQGFEVGGNVYDGIKMFSR
jgi:hypothetical protein